MPENAAELRSVSLTRGSVVALDDVSLVFPAHRTVAILGGSGSGKSSLIQLIIGLLEPDAGHITVLGETLNRDRISALRKRIGYAIQEVALFPHLHVRENILLPSVLEGWSARNRDERLAELLQLMHLPEDVLDRYPHELSGGQQQRAGLCRALMLRPELLLLDEPFSGLDTVTRRSIHQQFLDMRARIPVSILLVTHDPEEAARLADYMVIMQAGKLQQFGTVSDVLERPANEFVASLCAGLQGANA
jgi:osmoprotectant transport system ATP-binding protein